MTGVYHYPTGCGILPRMAPYLSVIIPTYNEEAVIEHTLTTLRRFLDAEGYPYEIIVVDDGSTDRTALKVETCCTPPIRLHRLPHRGKGSAVREGMLASMGTYRVFMDADLSISPEIIRSALTKAAEGYPVVIASRYVPQARYLIRPPLMRRILSSCFRMLTRILIRLPQHDTQNGFKLFHGTAARILFTPLETNGWCFDVEVLVRARIAGMSVAEIPSESRARNASRMTAHGVYEMFSDVVRIARRSRTWKTMMQNVPNGEKVPQTTR